MREDSLDLKNKDITLLDILDTVLETGVVIRGDLTISIADIELVYLDLSVLLASVQKLEDNRKRSLVENERTIQEVK
ncbi:MULTISPECIES: gas vesicle protein [Sinobaca]|uniref:Gas vesicle protein GvpA/GvpJ/GvpM family n=1 Tax=Sinobaca qinghaiensis TaxID=342944 RepID=A0A419V827_9BACL|nr:MULTISPECIES: gas vesicle protein [Sinobaca]RKD76241.1 gas vesicle protein GvpA/GvpJ/GvpM family [Sinobaca qinghaiensis]